jgi:hypothetical protein
MDVCKKCKNKIDEVEIYGDWFYCKFCNKEFSYKNEDRNKKRLDTHKGFI